MIFVINNLKYDTDKLELVSDKVKWLIRKDTSFLFDIDYPVYGEDVKLYKSKKDRWLLTYFYNCETCAVPLKECKVKELLIKYDLEMYEKIFGELEEA